MLLIVLYNDKINYLAGEETEMTITVEYMRNLIREELAALIEFRHDLHSHPELMYEEIRTSECVKTALEQYSIDYACNLAGGTGILAYIAGQDTHNTVALRADMDALPIIEETGLPYSSTNPGIMHACGHDGHTTILVGAARVLKRIADDNNAEGLLPRPVKFVFQPAEEGGAGGLRMIEDGILGDQLLGNNVVEMYGLHCWPLLELGKVSTKPGPLLASADMFDITIHGQMAHAAWPQRSKDPIIAGASMVNALQTIVSRNTDPIDSVVVSVTKFHSGTANNIIPETADIGGTLRALSEETRSYAKKRIMEIVEHIAAAHQCTTNIVWEGQGYPVTDNHPAKVEKFFALAKAAVGTENSPVWPAPVMGGEDFAFYCQQVPACFFVLGQIPPEVTEPYPMVHTPKFDFNDDSIALGIEMFCRIALELYDQ